MNTLGSLPVEFGKVKWNSAKRKTTMYHQLTVREQDNTKFILSIETVTAINDGGLRSWYNLGQVDIQS